MPKQVLVSSWPRKWAALLRDTTSQPLYTVILLAVFLHFHFVYMRHGDANPLILLRGIDLS